MEHIGNYLDKYRKMIAEYDERDDVIHQIGELGRQLEVAALEQGKAIQRLEDTCKDALVRLSELEKGYEDNKHQG